MVSRQQVHSLTTQDLVWQGLRGGRLHFGSRPGLWAAPGGAEGGANDREHGGMLMSPAGREGALRGPTGSLTLVLLLQLFVLRGYRLK